MDERYSNSLTFIRLLAAVQVMAGHIFIHLHISNFHMGKNIIGYFSGVPIFFAISGFVIWFSVERSPDYVSYIKKRFWRIYPELWVGVIVEILTIFIFYHGWNGWQMILFFFTQGSIFQFWTPDSLRGYGCGTPNGSLWTICISIQFYIVVWFLYKLLKKRRGGVWSVGFIFVLAASICGQLIAENTGIESLIKLYGQSVIRYLWLFYLGCFIAEFWSVMIPFLKRFWYIFLAAGTIFYVTEIDIQAGYQVFQNICMIMGVIGFAYRFPCLEVKVDLSYGIFIYHMIIVNVFITKGWVQEPVFFFFVVALSCVSAYLSSVTIGKWSAMHKTLNKKDDT